MRTLLLVLLSCAACSGGGGDSAIDEQEPNDTQGTALILVPRAVVDGVLGAGDRDFFVFVAPAHGLMVVRSDDFDLLLYDGALCATSHGVLHAAVVAGRTYHVEVGGSGAYRLTLDFTAESPLPGPVDPLATPRSFHAAIALPDGRALIAGGTLDPSSQVDAILNAIATTEIFEGDSFTPGPALSGARFGPAAVALPNGEVLIAGGDLGGTADLFDGESIVSIPMDGVRVLASATLLTDGRVLIAGGVTVVFNPLPSVETLATTTIFDPRTRAFTAGPALRAPRVSHAAVRVKDGRVLITGGVGRADSEWVDAATSIPGPALTGVRDDHTATLLTDGRVLLVGGQNASGRSLDTAELLEGGAFRTVVAVMADPRADHQAVRLPDGGVLILGGEDDPAGGPDVILTGVELFDPATELFTSMAPLRVPRDDHRVARLSDGRILVTGGEDETSTSIADVETYRAR